MTKLSNRAWKFTEHVIEKIKQHPFNLELAKGTLDLDKFAYYIEQDTLYLQDFARCHAIIASRAPLEHVRCFLRYADYTFITEQEIVHNFFREAFQFQETGLVTPATFSYTNYLLKTCACEPIEVAVAAVLPCFWVYYEVGRSIIDHATQENRFSRWIETYSGEAFASSVNEAICIFDALAQNASEATQNKMIHAFYKSTVLEWHFWNDSYNRVSFDGFLSPSAIV